VERRLFGGGIADRGLGDGRFLHRYFKGRLGSELMIGFRKEVGGF
jgi:hypothetical protein